MSNYSKLYWLTRLDHVNGIAILFMVLSIIAIIVTVICYFASKDFDEFYHGDKLTGRQKMRQRYTGKLKYYIAVLSIGTLVTVFLPTKGEAIFIVAGGKTMDFVQSDTSINKIPAQTTKIITDFLQKQIEESKK